MGLHMEIKKDKDLRGLHIDLAKAATSNGHTQPIEAVLTASKEFDLFQVVGRTHEPDDSDDSGTSTSKVVARNHEPDDSGKSKYEINNFELAELSEKNEDDDDDD